MTNKTTTKREVLWGFSSSGRAPALQAGGERFDPVNLHQIWALNRNLWIKKQIRVKYLGTKIFNKMDRVRYYKFTNAYIYCHSERSQWRF